MTIRRLNEKIGKALDAIVGEIGQKAVVVCSEML